MGRLAFDGRPALALALVLALFTPTDATRGTMSYSGASGGCKESGSGPYTVSPAKDRAGLTVTFTASGTVGCFGTGGNFTGSADFTLTEAPSAACR